MSISAMKQALEALDAYSWEQVDAARSALRQAIAEAEKQKPVAWYGDADGFPVYPAPVHAIDISQERVDETTKREHKWVEMQCQCGHKMYAKYTGREWAGLSHEERDQIDQASRSQMEALFAIEAKLKEKNS